MWSVIPRWYAVTVLNFAQACLLTQRQGLTAGRLDHKNTLWFKTGQQTGRAILEHHNCIGFSQTGKLSILTLISDRILLLPGDGTESTHRTNFLFKIHYVKIQLLLKEKQSTIEKTFWRVGDACLVVYRSDFTLAKVSNMRECEDAKNKMISPCKLYSSMIWDLLTCNTALSMPFVWHLLFNSIEEKHIFQY